MTWSSFQQVVDWIRGWRTYFRPDTCGFYDLPPENIHYILKLLLTDKDHRIWHYRLVSKLFDLHLRTSILPNLPVKCPSQYRWDCINVRFTLPQLSDWDLEMMIPIKRPVLLTIATHRVTLTDQQLKELSRQLRPLRGAFVFEVDFSFLFCNLSVSKAALAKFLKNPLIPRNVESTLIQLKYPSLNELKPFMRYVHSLPEVLDCHQFELFIATHGKMNASAEVKVEKFGVFMENLRLARERQAVEDGTAEFGWNKFSDMTKEEFEKVYLMDSDLLTAARPNTTLYVPPSDNEISDWSLPTSFDWRNFKAVTRVKNQGACGSCWAFSSTGNVESLYAVKRKVLIELSEQKLVDCSNQTSGCSGGWPILALRDAKQMGGVVTEVSYPYRATKGECEVKKHRKIVSIKDVVSLSTDAQRIAEYLVKHGAISVAFNARQSIMNYRGGIVKLPEKNCDPKSFNHAVRLVGYGIESGIPYWTVKNSWGANWGEKGYFRIFRGGNTCGIENKAVCAVLNL